MTDPTEIQPMNLAGTPLDPRVVNAAEEQQYAEELGDVVRRAMEDPDA
ncbi:hypothetical protein [Amycolatopsis sp. YIM 10]|nr:hypothetical protein [Amycolatopsis sp. YIM 10]QFU87899.1 hypothetical protein YIM_13565 [Amycolatopsis sp. YIM 10]QFU94788.1 hypothetical protein YIM_48315 [Amycolatopsis sp. YIM 10]